MRESVSDQWAISKWVGSDTGLITGTILEVHMRQNDSVRLNKFSLWATASPIVYSIMAETSEKISHGIRSSFLICGKTSEKLKDVTHLGVTFLSSGKTHSV